MTDSTAVKLNAVEKVISHPWFGPVSIGIVAYLFFGLFEESFGLNKPIRVILAIAVVISYYMFGDDLVRGIGNMFHGVGLEV